MCLPRSVTALLSLAAMALPAALPAAGIDGAVRLGGSPNTPPEVITDGLVDGALAYVDRPHEYVNLPPRLTGTDYVRVANDDKTVFDYGLEVEVAEEGELLLFIDHRIGDDDSLNPPDLRFVMTWVADLGFVDTGEILEIDEGGDGSVENTFAVYSLEVEAGVFELGPQNDGGSRNMYGVAFIPASGVSGCPLGLELTPAGTDIELSWTIVGDAPESVDIRRDGELIAEDADPNLIPYVDAGVPPGQHLYELSFDVPGEECRLEGEIDTCIGGVVARVQPGGVGLQWQNGATYAEIVVRRNGEEIIRLGGSEASYFDDTLPEGDVTYSVQPANGDCAPAEVTLEYRGPQGLGDVIRLGTSTNALPMVVPGGLSDNVPAFVDRPHAYVNLPEELLGIDYVQVANDDKTVPDYALELTIDEDGVLYLLIDHRIGDDDATTGPDLSFVMSWVLDMGFADTGLTVDIDEGADGSVDNTFALFELEVDEGVIELLEQNDGGTRNMYGVAFASGESMEPPDGTPFHRGDIDGNGSINITDGIRVLDYLFQDADEPPCLEAADANDDAMINISDGIYVLSFLFTGGDAPPAPGAPPEPCGLVPEATEDLGCETYTACE